MEELEGMPDLVLTQDNISETLREIRDELRRANRLKAVELSMQDSCDNDTEDEIDEIMQGLDDEK